MERVTLPNRLKKIADFISHAATVADIGCDHGLLGAALLTEGRAKRVIACDISAASLQKARTLAGRLGLGAMEFRAGDGLAVLEPGEADVIVVAGVGGMLIVDILRRGDAVARTAEKLILMPHRNAYDLRSYLYENGYNIKDEALAEEQGRYYNVICARRGKALEPDAFMLGVGRRLIEKKDPLLRGYLEKEIETGNKILKRALHGKENNDYCAAVELRIKKMEELLKCL